MNYYKDKIHCIADKIIECSWENTQGILSKLYLKCDKQYQSEYNYCVYL